MKIIGLGHQSGVGKDEFGKYLQHHLEIAGKTATCRSFAWKLKEICYELFSIYGLKKPIYYENNRDARNIKLKCGLTPIEIWCGVGDGMREIYSDIWIDNTLDPGPLDPDFVIIRDVRYMNEVDAIHNLGGVVWKIYRPGYDGLNTPADQALKDFSQWNMIIDNIGSLKDLSTITKELASII